MEQKILPPNDNDCEYIARMLIRAEDLFFEFSGNKHSYTKNDLEIIQVIIDSGKIEKEATLILQSLGLFFGRIFIENNEGYDWWIVEDEYGRDPAVRFQETSLVIFPQTMISKRVEDGEVVNIGEMYSGLMQMIDDIKAKQDFV